MLSYLPRLPGLIAGLGGLHDRSPSPRREFEMKRKVRRTRKQQRKNFVHELSGQCGHLARRFLAEGNVRSFVAMAQTSATLEKLADLLNERKREWIN